MLFRSKDSMPKLDVAKANSYVQVFDARLSKVTAARQEVVGRAQAILTTLDANSPPNCGFFSSDSLPCQTHKYKKETTQYLLSSANTYYEILMKRYQLYKTIALKSKDQCVRPEFLAKLASADEEYLISYERKSHQVFLRLLEAVQGAFLNQAPQ